MASEVIEKEGSDHIYMFVASRLIMNKSVVLLIDTKDDLDGITTKINNSIEKIIKAINTISPELKLNIGDVDMELLISKNSSIDSITVETNKYDIVITNRQYYPSVVNSYSNRVIEIR